MHVHIISTHMHNIYYVPWNSLLQKKEIRNTWKILETCITHMQLPQGLKTSVDACCHCRTFGSELSSWTSNLPTRMGSILVTKKHIDSGRLTWNLQIVHLDKWSYTPPWLCSIFIFRGVVVFTSHYCYWVDGHPNIKLGFIVLPLKPHKSDKIRNSEKEIRMSDENHRTQKDVSRLSSNKDKDFHETWKLHTKKSVRDFCCITWNLNVRLS